MSDPILRPLKSEDFGYWQAFHLLNRAGFGGTPAQIRLLTEWGIEKAVRSLVRFEDAPADAIDDSRFDATIMKPATSEQQLAYRLALRNGDEEAVERYRRMIQDRQRRDREQVRAMQKWWLERMIETARPLEEKMTLFYHGHFATGYRTIENSWHMFMQNQLFRRQACGNFAELCFQIIRDPAMIAYLDNDESHKRSPNENLARELMELFTLGEGHGYTERDIKEGARALTGYTFDFNSFIFRKDWHDHGRKTILGKTGPFDGDDFVRIVLGRRECSQYIALKLYRFFVHDLPAGPDETAKEFITALAARMRASRYDMADVLETLFLSEHFYNERNVAAQIKSPAQLTVQAVRSMRLPVRDLDILVHALDLMGQNLFAPPSVKGWEGGRSWINTSTLFVRQNLLAHLLTGRMPAGYSVGDDEPKFDAIALLDDLPPNGAGGAGAPSVEQAIDYLCMLCLGRDVNEARIRTLTDFANVHGGRIENRIALGLLCLITATPEYQLC